MEQNITSNDLQDALDGIINVLDKHKDKINTERRMNQLVKYIFGGALTYANGLKVLAREPEKGIWYQYDSMIPICRAFLEQYPIVCKLIELFPDEKLYDDYIKYLVILECVQDIKIFNSLKTDPTVESEAKRQESKQIHINNWIDGIKNFFPNEVSHINEKRKEKSLKQIIYNLSKKYDDKYKQDKNELIGNALQNNIAYKNNFGFAFRDAFQVYKLLCDETHSNIGAINIRSKYNGYISINESNKNNGEASVFTVMWCIKDIELRLYSLFQKI